VTAFRRATWRNLFLSILMGLNGLVPFGIYANEYFRKIEVETGEDVISPRAATYVYEGMHFVAQAIAIYFVKVYGRKTLLQFGCLTGCITCAVGYMMLEERYTMITVSLIWAYVFILSSTSWGTTFIYITETSQDIALGVLYLAICVSIMFSTVFTLWMINTWQFEGFFVYNAVLCGVSYLYVTKYIKETKGMSDKAKKNIYLTDKDGKGSDVTTDQFDVSQLKE
jgi:MFS family permease